jgi:hypothetical protein
MSIRFRALDRDRRDGAAGPRLVVNDDRLAEALPSGSAIIRAAMSVVPPERSRRTS